ncbi:MAG TPA: hypothetical protein VLR50_10290 [Desulfobacterales bacterium]|nr:hypothetical protein [Desulfobacterales bacterium]
MIFHFLAIYQLDCLAKVEKHGRITSGADEPRLTATNQDMAAMLVKRLDVPAEAGVAPLTDDYAPVDRFIMLAW